MIYGTASYYRHLTFVPPAVAGAAVGAGVTEVGATSAGVNGTANAAEAAYLGALDAALGAPRARGTN
jgi:hypothetical protein